MLSHLKPYLDIILSERSWSWTLIGIVYLMTGLIVRSWFLKPLVARAKQMDRTCWTQIKRIYLRHAVLGWFFFMIPLVIIIVLWYQSDLGEMLKKDILFFVIAGSSFILSVFFHLQAFGIALLDVLGETTQKPLP